MGVKLLLDSNKIYHKVFEGTKPGYDALQVDSFLDLVIKDYDTFAGYISNTESELSELKNKVRMLNEQLSQVEAENASLKAKFGNVSENEGVSLSNLELLKKIAKYEKALTKLGINPNTIKD